MNKLKILSLERIYEENDADIMDCLWDWNFITDQTLDKIDKDMTIIMRARMFNVLLNQIDPKASLEIEMGVDGYEIHVIGGDFVLFHYTEPWEEKHLFEMGAEDTTDDRITFYNGLVTSLNTLLNGRIICLPDVPKMKNLHPTSNNVEVIQEVIQQYYGRKQLSKRKKSTLIKKYGIIPTPEETQLYSHL